MSHDRAHARRKERRAARNDVWAVGLDTGRILVGRGRGGTDVMRSVIPRLAPDEWANARLLNFVPLGVTPQEPAVEGAKEYRLLGARKSRPRRVRATV